MSKLKTATTYEEQIAILQERGIFVSDMDACRSALRRIGYYRLSAYLLPFRTQTESYTVSFQRIAQIYHFDTTMHVILSRAILDIEVFLRSQIAYFHSHKYGAEGYLDQNIYNSLHNHSRFLDRIASCKKENENTPIVQHHNQKYGGHFPLWVIIEFFSMGMLSYFYSDLPTADQKAISREAYGQVYPLCSWLRCLTDLRNKCAHYSRMYFWKFSATPKMARVPFEPNRTLFTQIYMLKLLHPSAETWNAEVFEKIRLAIAESRDDVDLAHIGFPENWEDLLSK